MKRSTKIILIIASAFLLMQFISPAEPEQNPSISNMQTVPDEVHAILQNACFDCHSSTTNLRWYDKIFPVNFLVVDDINKGRKALNFSKWDSLPTPQQNSVLYNALNKVLAGEMPLPAYTLMHQNAKLSTKEIEILKEYAISRSPNRLPDSVKNLDSRKSSATRVVGNTSATGKTIKTSVNGIEYIPDYRGWKAISTTDRFDNGTMRIIFANEIAVEAIKDRKINPWPDGAILAKTAWKEKLGKDGIIRPGDFVQVEFMIKDAVKYKSTEGWGWARWRGGDLKPYGQIGFEQECVNCHKPVKDNDNVFTMPLNLYSISSKFTKK